MSYLLTKEVADKAIDLVIPVFNQLVESGVIERPHLHIVVLDPVYYDYNPDIFNDTILTNRNLGDIEAWEYPYNRFANCKARMTHKFKMPGQIIIERMPHLLKGHAIKYWGSAYLDGITVAASGVQPWFDQWVSDMVAVTCRALSKNIFETQIRPNNSIDTFDGELMGRIDDESE